MLNNLLEKWVMKTFVSTEFESVFELNELLLASQNEAFTVPLFNQSLEEFEHYELLKDYGAIENREGYRPQTFKNLRDHLHFCVAGEYIASKKLSVINLILRSPTLAKIGRDEQKHYLILRKLLGLSNQFSKPLFVKHLVLILLVNVSEVINSVLMGLIKLLFLVAYFLCGFCARVRKCMS
jgi:hypothetical protein